MAFYPRGGLGLGVVLKGKGFGGESGGLGMSVRGHRAWFRNRDRDQGWELFTEWEAGHRGKGLGSKSGGLGMSVREQGAWFRIREGGHGWELFTGGRDSEVRVEGWASM